MISKKDFDKKLELTLYDFLLDPSMGSSLYQVILKIKDFSPHSYLLSSQIRKNKKNHKIFYPTLSSLKEKEIISFSICVKTLDETIEYKIFSTGEIKTISR